MKEARSPKEHGRSLWNIKYIDTAIKYKDTAIECMITTINVPYQPWDNL
jgi:hypothetical protein